MDRPCINCQQYFDIREHNGKCPYCKFDNFNQSTCINNVSNKTKKINMKNFKNGQKVRHPKYGEGVITFHLTQSLYYVAFSETSRTWNDINDDFYNKLEPVEDLPNVGEYAYFWNDGWDFANYAKFGAKSNDVYYDSLNVIGYKNISKTPPF